MCELKRELDAYLQLEERRRKKREKEKEKRERDRAEGKLLSKAEKSAQAKRANILESVGLSQAAAHPSPTPDPCPNPKHNPNPISDHNLTLPYP